MCNIVYILLKVQTTSQNKVENIANCGWADGIDYFLLIGNLLLTSYREVNMIYKLGNGSHKIFPH